VRNLSMLTWSRRRLPRRRRGRWCWGYSHSTLSPPDWSYACSKSANRQLTYSSQSATITSIHGLIATVITSACVTWAINRTRHRLGKGFPRVFPNKGISEFQTFKGQFGSMNDRLQLLEHWLVF